MKRRHFCWSAICVMSVVLGVFVSPSGGVTLPFEDGFENIAVGDYPDENGWTLLFSGKSASVSDAVAHTGTKSFRLDSYPSWARMDYIYLDQVPDRLTYEVAICVDPADGLVAFAGFMKAVGNQGPSWNRFSVSRVTGQVRFNDVYVGQYTAGTWCTLRADLDFVNLEADLWMDGSLVVEDTDIYPKEFDDPTYGHMTANQWGVASHNYTGGSSNVVYFDDVRLYERIAAQIAVDPDTLQTRSKGKWITAYIELPEEHDPQDIEIASVRLNDQIPAETDPKYGFVKNPELKDRNGNGLLELMVKFSRPEVASILAPGENTVTISGQAGDTLFEGTDTIRVIP